MIVQPKRRFKTAILSSSVFIASIGAGMHLAYGQNQFSGMPGAAGAAQMSPEQAAAEAAARAANGHAALPEGFQPPPSSSFPGQNQSASQGGNVQPPMPPIPSMNVDSNSMNSSMGNSGPPAAPTPIVTSQVIPVLPESLAGSEPRVVLHTSKGDITIKVFKTLVPTSADQFLQLARGDREFVDSRTSKKVKRPFYDGLTFHKVLPDIFIQGGCPFGTGAGDPGFVTADEFAEQLNFDKPGMVAFAPARTGSKFMENSNGSQFFITLRPEPTWTKKFTIIGEVEKGLSVVKKISQAKAGPTDRPIRKIYIKKADVIEGKASKIELPTQATTPSAPSSIPAPGAASAGPADQIPAGSAPTDFNSPPPAQSAPAGAGAIQPPGFAPLSQ